MNVPSNNRVDDIETENPGLFWPEVQSLFLKLRSNEFVTEW